MAMSDADAAKVRAVIREIAPQMPGLSGPEQACVIGLACVRAGISPTWGEWAAFLRELQARGPIERGSDAPRQGQRSADCSGR
jgi:hypothetical protein